MFSSLFKRLDEFVEREYVILFFGAGIKHLPALNWMIQAYKRLSRNYKKNIKKLIVVHPTWWFKFVLFIMQKIVSSKFAKKIVNLDRLADLPPLLPMESIVIPAAVLEYDQKKGNPALSASLSTANSSSTANRVRERSGGSAGVKHQQRRRGDYIFGAQLESSAAAGEEAPEPILSLISYLRENALKEEGIFRTSPNQTDISELKDRLNRGIMQYYCKN